jgi:hypothetical protein
MAALQSSVAQPFLVAACAHHAASEAARAFKSAVHMRAIASELDAQTVQHTAEAKDAIAAFVATHTAASEECAAGVSDAVDVLNAHESERAATSAAHCEAAAAAVDEVAHAGMWFRCGYFQS